MKALKTKNNELIALSNIPVLELGEFRQEIIGRVRGGQRILAWFAAFLPFGEAILAILADDEQSRLFVVATPRPSDGYESLTSELPAMQLFERELYEQSGIQPKGHPWLKPVRYPHDAAGSLQEMADYPFFAVDGDEVHLVGVGPIHAGVIEPGHFRFNCHGEEVLHLEIQLGYQHRGIERLMVERHATGCFQVSLAESIAGDTVIAHAGAYARLMETMSGVLISDRASVIRAMALELERAAIHIGDLGALAGDIAFQMGAAVFAVTRTLVINALMHLTGSRFGRGLIRVGGVAMDFDDAQLAELTKTLTKVAGDVERMASIMFSEPTVLSRFEDQGVVSRTQAARIGMVGLAARASGLALDIRADHPFGAYKRHSLYKRTMEKGDIFARAYLRYLETMDSIKFVLEESQYLPKVGAIQLKNLRLAPEGMVISMMEGWRGEVVHIGLTDNLGKLARYKIKDPSFNNWLGLALAMRGNGISDFPVCNKSFNLSYCGFDL